MSFCWRNQIIVQKCASFKQIHRKEALRFLNRRNFSKETSTKEPILTFSEVVSQRRDEANRSILVQVQSAQSYKELHSYCNVIGDVKNMFHYTTGVEPMHFILVEFAKEQDVKNVFTTSAHIEESQVVPVQSPFLWFKAAAKHAKLKPSRNVKLAVENGNQHIKELELWEVLRNMENVTEQMIKLYDETKLNELGCRLRFLVAKQVESSVLGMFPTAKAYPFGSTVNGYGRMGCDLDLVLKLYHNEKEVPEDVRLVYHCKASMGSERTISQRHMDAIGDLIQLFLPGCSQVRKILQARVPIIKYYQQLADVECDLSMSNLSGVYMSDFLYVMASIDDRVRPLVFTIRKWASEVGLTNSSPGRWITNFSLTLLVLSFLQTKPILPSLNGLVKMSGKNDRFTTEDGVNCTFLRNANVYLKKHPTTNSETLKTLLQEFFEYYSQFDFTNKAVCLNEPTPITKPEHSALYIVNPLERGLNVSKNVSIEELDKFRMELRNAAWILESEENKPTNWGLLNLFITRKRAPLVNGSGQKQVKLIQVSKLFEEDLENEFKNNAVKREVRMIKKESKEQLKKLGDSIGDFNRHKSRR